MPTADFFGLPLKGLFWFALFFLAIRKRIYLIAISLWILFSRKRIIVFLYLELERTLQKIPPEIMFMYSGKKLNRERGDVFD